jgi:thioredoxin-related protein
MKRLINISLIAFFAILLSTATYAQESSSKGGIKWYTFQEAMKLNQKHPKKIFIDMYTDWCGWCKKMDASTFKNPVIAKYMNENYYPVKFNAERKDTVDFKGKEYVNANPKGSRSSHQLAQALLNGRMSYPSYVFMDQDENLITVVPGYQKAPQFESILHFISTDAYKNVKWEDYMQSFKATATE